MLDQKNPRRALRARNRLRNRSARTRGLRTRVLFALLGCGLGLVIVGLSWGPMLRALRPDAAPSRGARSAVAGGAFSSAPERLFARLPVGVGNTVYAYADDPIGRESSGVAFASATSDPFAGARLVEVVPAPMDRPDLVGPLRVEYSLDAELTRSVFRILRAARVERGHVIVLDPDSGRVIAYASTDPVDFPPTRAYPAASLIKVVTANAVLETMSERAHQLCLYRGNPYRLRPGRVQRPSRGHRVSLEMALATSNNQCFAQFAVNDVGSLGMLDAVDQFGWLVQSGPGHDAGSVELGTNDYDLGRLGCGLAGCRITPLHAARLAATLASGESVEPWWVDRVIDGAGNELTRPEPGEARRVMSVERARKLREMMVRTTTRGTARSAFRDSRGRPKLDSVRVAGKTGNLSGKDPKGRYEWFIGTAPADDPSVAIAVLQLHGHLWWKKSSELAADVLSEVFCDKRVCDATLANRYTGRLGQPSAPIFLSERGS